MRNELGRINRRDTILAGGSGSSLNPITKGISKQLILNRWEVLPTSFARTLAMFGPHLGGRQTKLIELIDDASRVLSNFELFASHIKNSDMITKDLLRDIRNDLPMKFIDLLMIQGHDFPPAVDILKGWLADYDAISVE